MKRGRGGKIKSPKTKTIELKAKHAKPVRSSHVLSLALFCLIGLGVLLVGFIYVNDQYDKQQTINSLSRDQLDYVNYQGAPIDTITFAVLSVALVVALFGLALTFVNINRHSTKHHVYRVTSGHYIPVPHKQHRQLAADIPFAVGQTEESRQRAQSAVNSNPHTKPEAPVRVKVQG